CSGRRMGKLAHKSFSTLDDSFAPDILLHSMGSRHPWTTRLTPTGRAGYRHFHSQLIALLDGVTKSIFPLGSHLCQTLVNDLRRLQGRIEVLETGNSHSVHPLKIELDAFLGNVAIHPMPPDSRFGGVRRVLKALLQRVCGILCPTGSDDADNQYGEHEPSQ